MEEFQFYAVTTDIRTLLSISYAIRAILTIKYDDHEHAINRLYNLSEHTSGAINNVDSKDIKHAIRLGVDFSDKVWHTLSRLRSKYQKETQCQLRDSTLNLIELFRTMAEKSQQQWSSYVCS